MKKLTLLVLLALPYPYATQGQENLDPEAIFSSSYTLEAEENYQEAFEVLASIYDPASYELNLRLGWLSYLNGEYPASRDYYSRAVGLFPYAIEAKLGYVLPVAAQGNWNEVVEIYNQILKIDPQNTLVNYRMGLISYERGEYEAAFHYVEKVVNLYPFDYDSVILFAWIHLKMGDFRKAEVLFKKSLLIYPGNESANEGLLLIQ